MIRNDCYISSSCASVSLPPISTSSHIFKPSISKLSTPLPKYGGTELPHYIEDLLSRPPPTITSLKTIDNNRELHDHYSNDNVHNAHNEEDLLAQAFSYCAQLQANEQEGDGNAESVIKRESIHSSSRRR